MNIIIKIDFLIVEESQKKIIIIKTLNKTIISNIISKTILTKQSIMINQLKIKTTKNMINIILQFILIEIIIISIIIKEIIIIQIIILSILKETIKNFPIKLSLGKLD
jgi:hypothetical protein